ncbi:hypothetical protein [Sphingopyxis flava]|uniref:LPXTG-motif cell wall anchor domain-containing protein n=1 Tax=Sphingopyxis flava TaxID=1507287 RepID=A0A1T5CG13_9SPHN|nr:hypothetical protein [Sphingopyxis flava]SKB58296.1 hypothetical protein SAMN06295937_101030 [Sphingopyxis flava]
MNKNFPLSRPATSAIAAFLAITAPAAFAQEAPNVPMTSPVAAPPPVIIPAPAPATPTVEETAPAPKPVIRVPLDLPAPAEPAPAAEAEVAPPPQRAARPVAAERSERAPAAAPRISPPAPAEAPSAAAAPAAPADTPAEPVAIPMTSQSEPVADNAPAAADERAAADNGFPWELVGGAAALLLAGGAGLAFLRRRRGAGEIAPGMSYEAMAAAEAMPYNPPVTPERTPPAARRAMPAFPLPHGSMGRHQALAMAGPTPENPFATLSKRLKRARFLDQKERQAYADTLGDQKDLRRKPASAWEVSQRAEPAPLKQEVHRPEAAAARKGPLRPGWYRP